MKKYLFLSLAAIVGMLAFTACGDDEPDIDPDNNNGKVEVKKAKFTETANKMELTYSISVTGTGTKVTCDVKETATFEGDECVKYIYEYTYPSADYAKAAYQAALEEQKNDPEDNSILHQSGKVFTADESASYKGVSKDVIRQEMKAMEAFYNK